ncbi:MAG TPA: hypothetical protein VIJ35_04115, partial [Bradyrhizobium sp.]
YPFLDLSKRRRPQRKRLLNRRGPRPRSPNHGCPWIQTFPKEATVMLVRRVGPTKAFAAQIRRAPAGRTKTDSSASMGQNMIVSLPDHLPTSELDVSVTGFFDKLQKMNMFSTFNLRMAVNISAQ